MKKILIIDDDKLTGSILEDMLCTQNYSTERAFDGESGLKLYRNSNPDAVLLDLVMPGLNGIAVCEQIRKLESGKRTPIIIVSTRGDKKIIASALGKGADDFIVKPVDELELSARLDAQLRISDYYSELEEDKRNLETILEVSKAVSATLDAEEILDIIVGKVADAVDAVRCSIVLIADNSGYVLASHDNPRIREHKLDLRKYPEIREVIETKKPVVIEDIATHPMMEFVRAFVSWLKGMSVMVVPIVMGEEVVGTLFMRAKRKGKFTEKEVNFCQIVANASYHAIKHAKLFERIQKEKEELKEIAITDRLTSLYNHNYFYTRLEEEFERAMRYGGHLAVLMLDIDDFKRINDGYGHRMGDMVLKEISALIKKCVRRVDLVARYGGEEFAVILPQTPLEGAAKEAERIRTAVGDHCYANLIKEKITMSIGAAHYPASGIFNSGDLVNCADKALYQAKSEGKNLVKIFGSGRKPG
jgi:two-component system cell cycle response regulator